MEQLHITDGLLVGGRFERSPNQSGNIEPKFITMHYTANNSLESTVDRFNDPHSEVSAHFTIDQHGNIVQHVSCDKKAWHAGPSSYQGYSGMNSHSIGIELVNIGWLRKVGENQYTDSYGNRWGDGTSRPLSDDDVIASENARVGSGMFYWPHYTTDQLEAAEALCAALIDEYRIVDIVSHEEIDNRGWKTDPGPAFPMNRFRALLGERSVDMLIYEVTASTLRVRSAPDLSADILKSLPKGRRVQVAQRKGDWVQLGDQDGWVHGDFLRLIG